MYQGKVPCVLPTRLVFHSSLSKANIKYSDEAKLAAKGKITNKEAVQRAYRTRSRVASATPHSVALIAGGNGDVNYQNGICCYVDGTCIRILNVHDASQSELVVDVGALLTEELGRHGESTSLDLQGLILDWTTIQEDISGWSCGCESCSNKVLGKPGLVIRIYGSRCGILCFSVKTHHVGPYLVVVDIRSEIPLQERFLRIQFGEIVDTCTDGRYLFVVGRSRRDTHTRVPKHTWALQCFDLMNKECVLPHVELQQYMDNGHEAGHEAYHSSAVHDGY